MYIYNPEYLQVQDKDLFVLVESLKALKRSCGPGLSVDVRWTGPLSGLVLGTDSLTSLLGFRFSLTLVIFSLS